MVGRAIVLTPVHHLMHNITVDRTGEASRFRPFWGVAELFYKQDSFPIGVGDRLYGGLPLWEWSTPRLQQTFADFVEREALPKLHRVKSLRDYVVLAMPSAEDRQAFPVAHVRYCLALGELDQARDFLATDSRASDWWSTRLEELGIKDRLMLLGNALGKTDRAKLAGLLHEWEAYTVHELKIAHLWERMPFPLEE